MRILRGHWRRAQKAGPIRRRQAVDLWIEFGGDETAHLLSIPLVDVLALVVVASYDDAAGGLDPGTVMVGD